MDLREILKRLSEGSLTIDEAERMIKLLSLEVIDGMVRLDLGREQRRGFPEIILAEHKEDEALKMSIRRIVELSGRAIVSRLERSQLPILEEFRREGFEVKLSRSSRLAIVKRRGLEPPRSTGRVGIVTGGTADIPLAEEVEMIVEELGFSTTAIYDVGVSGLHRAIEAAKRLLEDDVDVVVAVAGMEGALPSVIASLIDVPVIGLPASKGYGVGGRGISALLSMLQSCSLGLTVVNVDNSVGAAVAAALIARRVARFKDELAARGPQA